MMSVIETVQDKLQKYINNFLKYAQTNIDITYGIESDNSNEKIVMPNQFMARGIGTISCMVADNFNTYWWGYGGWSMLYDFDIECSNGDITLSNWNRLGRYKKSNWDSIVPYSGGTPNANEGDRLLSEYINSHEMPHIVKKTYPDLPISPNYYINNQNIEAVNFDQNNGSWTGAGLFNTYQTYNGYSEIPFPNIKYGDYSLTFTDDNVYVDTTEPVTACYDGTMCVSYKNAAFVTRTNDTNYINKYITNNDADNNYTYNYTTSNGDNVTVYYGDNYIIYKCDDDAEITYNENKEILDVVSNQINIDTGSHIHVPTYDETKYGPPSKVEDIETEMPLAYISGIAGMVHYIKINDTGLASADDISNALSRFDITTIGKDLLRNFVSLKVFAILDIDPDNSVTKEITVAGHILKDSNDNNLQGQYIGGVKAIDFTVGTVPVAYEDFRDYAPYTKIECYVPFCGWFSLPSWCIGKTIHGTMFTDICNGTVKAVIYADNTVVSEVGGCCAFDIPFVADATGAKAGAVISSALSTAAATAATVAVPNIGTGITAVSSAANTICAANDNSTTLKGVLGDGSNLNGLLHCYLKITRPQSPTELTIVPYSYKHEFGIPCYKQLTMTEGDGFTQVNDANITGAMTDREKQMIIDGFRHGLIL